MKHTCFSSLIYAQWKSRAEQKEQALNAENMRVQSHGEMRQNAYMWGKSHSNINANGKTNWEANQRKQEPCKSISVHGDGAEEAESHR